ncbi:MAG: DUF4167 domain-containing protein [Roseiarcus sp.]|uniref:DUF4167 domain-containing protein n=1 Tax=Roseiarcus sp. TaxID=1969460 RepID=UPI003C47C2CA
MRPGQNKRMRGRPNNNRRGPNPLTRSYESNGPDVKIRGNAHHVAEKYLQLARDAHTGGDPVAAENYLQHAEHYFRLIAAAQAAQALAQSGQQRATSDGEIEDDDDDDFGGPSDRFASPAERAGYQNQQNNAFSAQPNVAPNAPQPYVERQPFEGDRQGQGDRGGFPNRQDRQGNRFPDRGPRQDRPFGERPDGYRDNRQNRDGRPRDFRPYRDSAPPPPPRDGAPEAPGPAALPPFITGGTRPGPAEGGESPGPGIEPRQTPVDAPDADMSINDGDSEEGRFPGRGRRRRLRSPYGFKVGQGDADMPNPSPVDDETPVSE